MQIARRELLAGAAATATMHVSARTKVQGAPKMYGLIAKLISVPNRREDLIAILKESTANMPGCFGYIIAKDMANENTIWVTEFWDSVADHDALFIDSANSVHGK
jgi:antibiotic biosynthesis monooxygenase